MAKINLNISADRSFGKYLPSVYINRILIGHPADADSITDKSIVTFEVDLSVNFTFEGGDKDVSSLEDWIDHHLSQLYLYTFISPYTTFNNQLLTYGEYYTDPYYTAAWYESAGIPASDNFFDEHTSGYMDGVYETDGVPEGQSFVNRHVSEFLNFYVVTDETESVIYNKVKLKDLLGSATPLADLEEVDGAGGLPGMVMTEVAGLAVNSYLTKREVYDDKGNEIIRIENIKIKFQYDQSETDVKSLNSIEKLFFIATIGLDNDDLDDAPRSIYNNYFGGITFETIMNYGQVDDSFTEIFVDNSNGAPYDGIPLQALNGKYYAEEPIGRTDIINRFGAIIADYKNRFPRDTKLGQNIANLQYLLAVNRQSTNLFREFKKFQRTYTEKSQATASGRFYAEVVNEMVTYSKKIILQREVRKKLIYNSIVVDVRETQFLVDVLPFELFPDPSTRYTRGNFSAEYGGDPKERYYLRPSSDGAYGVASDDYIPRK